MKKNKKNNRKKNGLGLRESMRVIGRIVKDTRPIAGWLLLAVIVSLLSVGLSMVAPDLLGRLTDAIYYRLTDGVAIDGPKFGREVVLLAVVYVGSAVLGALTTLIMNYSVSKHFTCRIRVDMSAKISKIPIKTVDTTPNGEIISRMTNDVSVMGGTVHDIFGVVIGGVVRLAVISVVIFTENPILASAVVVFVPISIILSALLAARSEKHFDQSRTAAGKVYALCEENLTGFDTVKAFNLEKSQQVKYDRLVDDYEAKAKRGYVVSGTVQPIVVLVNNIAYVAICLIGGILAVRGHISAGGLVAFVMYTKLFSGPLESIAGGMSMMQSAIASARRVYGFLDGEEMEEIPRNHDTGSVLGEVIFDGVYFSYTDDKPLIEDLNMVVHPGEKVAIVGPTGGGKTTIVNLLMRFYDPQRGRILVDGEDIGKMNRADVREKFGMVLQDTVLFSGTVYDNIAYGKDGATEEEVIEAARRAHIDGFIESLPDGYQTKINEDSTNISGGQKQLLTIARAYLADRPILILDEATSNVDTRTELLIQATIDELMRDRTAFVIAHRLSTVENADIILVVDGGRIVERGTHRELIESGGLYSRIHKSQYSGS